MCAVIRERRFAASLIVTLLVVACSDSTGPGRACSVTSATSSLLLGQTVEGSLSKNDCSLNGGNAEGWRFTATSSTVVVFDVPGVPGRSLSLSNGQMDWVMPEIVDFPASQIMVPVVPGEYIVWVSTGTFRVTGPYQLSARLHNTPPCPAAAGTVSMGQVVSGRIEPGDCEISPHYPADSWQFSLAAPTTLRLALTSDHLNMFLILTTPQGQWLDFDDDSGTGNSAWLGITLPAGDYAVVATTYAHGFDAAGDYALAMQPASAPTP